jgi:hypothetical protein
MSFQEAGAGKPDRFTEAGIQQVESTHGWQWKNLDDDCCPACSDMLFYFEHIDLWKCGCGFKISKYRKQEITTNENRSGGFYLGNYHDETPF